MVARTWPRSSTSWTGRPTRRFCGLLHGHVDVDLEAGVLVDGGEDRRAGHAVAHPHGDVAHDARRRRGHPVVGEGHALLADLRLGRRELGLARGERRSAPAPAPPCWPRPPRAASSCARPAAARTAGRPGGRPAATPGWRPRPAACRASMCMSGVPGRTRSPERARIRVTKPSTCGCTVVERRDLTVPTNSVVCSTGRSTRVTTSTGIAGAPPGGPAWAAAGGGEDGASAATRASARTSSE